MYYVSIDPSQKLDREYSLVDYGGIDSPVIEVIRPNGSELPIGTSSVDRRWRRPQLVLPPARRLAASPFSRPVNCVIPSCTCAIG